MTSRTAAQRYARALFDVALKEQADLSRIETELDGFATLIAHNLQLRTALLNPAVPTPRKRAAVAELTDRAAVLPIISKILVLLAERDRLALLPAILEAFRDRLLDYRHVVRAEVTTAAPLESGRAEAIEQSLHRLTGRTVSLTTRLDPALIGGVVTRVGGTVYDGSLATHLTKLKQRLSEKA